MNAGRLAAILIDPMPSRAGLIEPTQEFIATINKVAKQHGIVIIADEVLNLRRISLERQRATVWSRISSQWGRSSAVAFQ